MGNLDRKQLPKVAVFLPKSIATPRHNDAPKHQQVTGDEYQIFAKLASPQRAIDFGRRRHGRAGRVDRVAVGNVRK